MGIKWKKAEKQLLWQKLAEEGLTMKDIVIPGRKAEYIRRQVLKMGLIQKLRHPTLTKEQKTKLRELREQGLSARQISDLDLLGRPRRTAAAIQKNLGKLGLVSKNRSLAAKNRKIWRNGEKQEFDDFLRQQAAKLTSEQIAEMFGVKEVTVSQRKRILGVKTSFAETLALPYVREKIRKSSQQRARKILLSFEEHIAKREKKLQALAQIMRRQIRIVPMEERRCKKCGVLWLKHRKFFFHATVRINSYSIWYFSRVCVICVAKQRHQEKVAEYQRRYSQCLE